MGESHTRCWVSKNCNPPVTWSSNQANLTCSNIGQKSGYLGGKSIGQGHRAGSMSAVSQFFLKGSPSKGFRLWSHRTSVATTQIAIDKTQTVVWASSDKILFTKLWQMGFGSRAWVCWPPIYILMWVVVTWVCVEIHWATHLYFRYFIVCQL